MLHSNQKLLTRWPVMRFRNGLLSEFAQGTALRRRKAQMFPVDLANSRCVGSVGCARRVASRSIRYSIFCTRDARATGSLEQASIGARSPRIFSKKMPRFELSLGHSSLSFSSIQLPIIKLSDTRAFEALYITTKMAQ